MKKNIQIYFSNIKDYSSETFLWKVIRNNEVNDIFNALDSIGSFENKSKLVDIGCGNGKYLSLFSVYFNTTYNVCVDISTKMLANIKDDKYHCLTGDIENLPIKHGVFDIAICMGSLEFTDYKKTIIETLRIINDSGSIALFFPRKNLFYFIYYFIYYNKGIKLSSVSRDWMIKTLNENGFVYFKEKKCGLFGNFIFASRVSFK